MSDESTGRSRIVLRFSYLSALHTSRGMGKGGDVRKSVWHGGSLAAWTLPSCAFTLCEIWWEKRKKYTAHIWLSFCRKVFSGENIWTLNCSGIVMKCYFDMIDMMHTYILQSACYSSWNHTLKTCLELKVVMHTLWKIYTAWASTRHCTFHRSSSTISL